jgi:hypothetical protein
MNPTSIQIEDRKARTNHGAIRCTFNADPYPFGASRTSLCSLTLSLHPFSSSGQSLVMRVRLNSFGQGVLAIADNYGQVCVPLELERYVRKLCYCSVDGDWGEMGDHF